MFSRGGDECARDIVNMKQRKTNAKQHHVPNTQAQGNARVVAGVLWGRGEGGNSFLPVGEGHSCRFMDVDMAPLSGMNCSDFGCFKDRRGFAGGFWDYLIWGGQC